MSTAASTSAGTPAVPDTPPAIPPEYADFAFEYKLGWAAGADPKARCPIERGHYMAQSRRSAWVDGYNARRKALGIAGRAPYLSAFR